jgi:quercetin dioxygenase-like cupin family protein
MTDVAGLPPMVLRPGKGEQLPLIGMLRASAIDTGGAFEVIEYTGPATPPPHVHREHDEIFVILTGTFRFVLGQDTAEAPRGAIVLVPRGTRHGFTIEPGASALLMIIPAGLEGFFKELGTVWPRENPARRSAPPWRGSTTPIPLRPPSLESPRSG